MNTKSPLNIALAIASIAVTCTPISAEISIEAVGIPLINLASCPEQKTLPCTQFFQYKVFGHFSLLTLGDRSPKKNQATQLTSHSPAALIATQTRSITTQKAKKTWNRLRVLSDRPNSSLDIFHSSALPHSTTGTVLIGHPSWDASKNGNSPLISIEGNTKNPQGMVVLCVDFIPCPPQPTGSLSITQLSLRAGEKAPLAWRITR